MPRSRPRPTHADDAAGSSGPPIVLQGGDLALASSPVWPEAFVAHIEALKEEFAREKRQLQDLFASLSFALRAFNNLNQILELIPFLASRLTDADGGALVLFNDNGTVQLERLHCLNMGERAQIQAVLEHVTHTVSDQEQWPLPPTRLESFLDEQVQHQLGAGVTILGAPLLIRNLVRGRLYVFSHNPEPWRTVDHQKLLQIIADQAAVALENNELAAELRRTQALAKEVESGSDIQHSLLPHSCPDIPGVTLAAHFEAASKVGGDYYDFIPVSPNPCADEESVDLHTRRWAIVVGDVMGKGVPAGMLMTATRAILRVLTYHRPAQVLRHLNRAIFHDLENSNRFITLFYSEYDPWTQQLIYSNAAHNPVLWWQAHEQKLTSLDSEGSLIGLDSATTYDEKTIQLHPGDILVYYTDGFTESSNRRGERWEVEGMEKAVQWAAQRYEDPHRIVDSLFAQIKAFRQSQEPNPRAVLAPLSPLGGSTGTVDDMTLVVVKVGNPPAPPQAA